MIFGKTDYDLYRAAREAADKYHVWHPFFAALPKRLNDGRWAWLQRVWRRYDRHDTRYTRGRFVYRFVLGKPEYDGYPAKPDS